METASLDNAAEALLGLAKTWGAIALVAAVGVVVLRTIAEAKRASHLQGYERGRADEKAAAKLAAELSARGADHAS
jgi:hypothetical protein